MYGGNSLKKNTIRIGLFVAGAMNIGGVLVFSRAFTNQAINDADPVVMSNFGLVMIAVWGLAYIGAAAIASNIRWLIGAFALEKLVYVIVSFNWLLVNSLSQLYSKDFMAGMFYSIYGLNDLAFLLFFASVFWFQRSGK